MDGWMDGWMDGRTRGCLDAWMHAWMYRVMDGCSRLRCLLGSRLIPVSVNKNTPAKKETIDYQEDRLSEHQIKG